MRILVIRYSGLGDIVMLLQTLKKVKEKYNATNITLLTDTSNAGIIPLTDNLINDVITINRKHFKERNIFASFKELFKVFKGIRKHYDMCIDFQCFGETATISYLTNSKIKLGAPKRDKYNYGYTDIIKREDFNHRSQLFSRIAQVDDKLDFSKLYLNNEANAYKNLTLRRLDRSKRTIGLNIGSTQENRRWSEENFNILANRLKDKYNILVFLGPSEKQYRDSFDKGTLFVENVNIIKLCGAIDCCDYFITNDTGPAHIAAALNIPTLTLFSTGDDYNVGVLIDKKDFIKNKVINNISIEDIEEKLNTLI